MVSQSTVRSSHQYKTLQSLSSSPVTYLTIALVTIFAGCRSPWGPGFWRSEPAGAEPSFDRLMEIENNSASIPPSFHPQVTNRRPGSSPMNSRMVDLESPASSTPSTLQPQAQYAAQQLASQHARNNRRLSDLEPSESQFADDEPELHEPDELLKNTQIALKNSRKLKPITSNTEDDFSQSNEETEKPRRKSSARKSEDQIVLRMSDEIDDGNLKDYDQEPRLADNRSKPAGSRKELADRAGDGKKSTDVSAVVPAAASKQGADRSVQFAGGVSTKADEAKLSSTTESTLADSSKESLTWEQHLQQAIKQLQKEPESLDGPQQRIRRQIVSRLLSLSLNDREGMLESIQGLPSQEQDYFNYQLSAFFDSIDPEAPPKSSRKWSLVMLNQRKANSHLAALSNLEINNMAFCTEVIDFGVINPFTSNKFKSSEEVLLYLELDNFVSEKSRDGKGFETQLQGSYEIVDSSGRRIADQTLPTDSHVCKNIRRDYFIAYRIYLPQNITPGNYTLKLTVEDLKGHKFGQSDIQFQIQ